MDPALECFEPQYQSDKELLELFKNYLSDIINHNLDHSCQYDGNKNNLVRQCRVKECGKVIIANIDSQLDQYYIEGIKDNQRKLQRFYYLQLRKIKSEIDFRRKQNKLNKDVEKRYIDICLLYPTTIFSSKA